MTMKTMIFIGLTSFREARKQSAATDCFLRLYAKALVMDALSYRRRACRRSSRVYARKLSEPV